MLADPASATRLLAGVEKLLLWDQLAAGQSSRMECLAQLILCTAALGWVLFRVGSGEATTQ